MKPAPALLERAARMRCVLGDKGYEANRLRRLARDVGAVPVIPGRRNRKRVSRYDKDCYCGRHLIENAFCRLKDCAAYIRATTSSPPASSQPYRSHPLSLSGCERV